MKSAPDIKKKKIPIQNKTIEKSFTLVAIGASAGGLQAMTSFLQNLSPDTGMAFI